MGLLDARKKKPAPVDKPDLQQNLGEQAKFSGVYTMFLLFREKVQAPAPDTVLEALRQRFGGVDPVSVGDAMSTYALREHLVTYHGGQQMPSQLLLAGCSERKPDLADAVARTQFWECPGGGELLDSCPYQVMLSDFMAGGLPALERADILAGWVEVALSLFPGCAAVFFQPSGKLLAAAQLHQNPYQGPLRFFWGGVNTRFFRIHGGDAMLVDTLGMYALGLPDVQCHFRELDPNDVVGLVSNIAIYQFENNAPIQSGHTVAGLAPDDKWTCQYERSLIQPVRDVLDIAPGPYAAGDRR